MLNEFQRFIRRGNVLDLAVGVIIGAAFTAIVNSLVSDVINPLIGVIVGGRADFSNYFLPLAGQTATTLAAAREAGPVLAYGAFLTAVVNFLLVAFVVFLLMRLTNRVIDAALRLSDNGNAAAETTAAAGAAAPTEAAAAAPAVVDLLVEIRDLLAQRDQRSRGA
jgi:large conductance mechanosensitive channel